MSQPDVQHHKRTRENDQKRNEIDKDDDDQRPNELEKRFILLTSWSGDGASFLPLVGRRVKDTNEAVRPEAMSVDADDENDEEEENGSCDVKSTDLHSSVRMFLDDDRFNGHRNN